MDYDNPVKTVVRFEDGSEYAFKPDPSLTAVQNDDIITQRAEDLGLAYGWGRPVSYTGVWI